MRQHYTFTVGETWIIDITDTDTDGSALDLTGATARFRLSKRSGDTVLDLTSPSGITIESAAGGTARLLVGPPGTEIDPDTYKYEHRVSLADGTVSTQASGYIVVNPTLY